MLKLKQKYSYSHSRVTVSFITGNPVIVNGEVDRESLAATIYQSQIKAVTVTETKVTRFTEEKILADTPTVD